MDSKLALHTLLFCSWGPCALVGCVDETPVDRTDGSIGGGGGGGGGAVMDAGYATSDLDGGRDGGSTPDDLGCAEGFQDYDGNGDCSPTCSAADLDCGTDPTTRFCEDSSGTATCICADGYQDNNGNGTCYRTCDNAELDCGNDPTTRFCDDSSGMATCVCAEGYQDYDGDEICLQTCDNAELDCGTDPTIVCDDSSGTAICACIKGYQDYDGNETCLQTCSTADLDCDDDPAKNWCNDSTGTAVCACGAAFIDDLFDNNNLTTGGTTATNGGFGSYNSCGGEASESGGAMHIAVPVKLDCIAGGVSNNYIKAGDFEFGFTAYWDVSAIESTIPSTSYFVLQQRNGYSVRGTSRPSLTLSIGSDGLNAPVVALFANDNGGNVHTYYDSSISAEISELAGGFRVWLTVHPTNGYGFRIEGLSETIASSGAWVSTHDYDDLFGSSTFSDNVRLAAYIGGNATTESIDLEISHMALISQCPSE